VALVFQAPQDPRSLFEAGQNAHQSGDLARALQFYDEALKRDPSLWPVEMQRGVALLSLGRLGEARASNDRVIKLLGEFSDSPDLKGIISKALVVRGEIEMADSKPAEAEAAFRRSLDYNPQSGPAHAGIAEVLLASNKFAEASVEAKAAISAGDDRSSTWTVLGSAQLAGKQYDDAISSFGEAIRRNPKQVPALRSRAEALIAQNKLPAAVSDLKAAAAIDGTPATRLRLAEVMIGNKQYDEAIVIFEQILKEQPDNSDARTGLAAAMIDSGRAPEAIAQLEGLIKEQPARADLRAQLAVLYLANQPDKALEHYSEAGRLEPKEARHQIGIGTSLVRLRKFQEAIPVLKGVLAGNPRDEIAYFAHTNLATAFFELDDFPNAGTEYLWILKRQQAAGDRRRAAVTLFFLGICFDKLGDLEQAQKAYQQFLALASSENQLEIDKVKLRLPSLERQIREGKGRRK
jgi:tetratricopeptide (TPR) repeat protein